MTCNCISRPQCFLRYIKIHGCHFLMICSTVIRITYSYSVAAESVGCLLEQTISTMVRDVLS